jgi:ketol-acid reductoisomerase
MAAVLERVRSGEFARALREEATAGYPKLRAARSEARSLPIEAVYQRLKGSGTD